jgi:hypothetical protein
MPRHRDYRFTRKRIADERCDDNALGRNGAPRIVRDRLLERLRKKHSEGGAPPSPASTKAEPKP